MNTRHNMSIDTDTHLQEAASLRGGGPVFLR